MTGLPTRLIARLRRLRHAATGYLRFGRRIEVFGPFTVIEPGNVRFGRNVAVNHGVFLLGHAGIDIGDDVVLSARVMVLDSGLDLATPERRHTAAPVAIGRRAWLGAGAIVLPGVTIGEGAVVGAGSVVTRSVPAWTIWAGNPARRIGDVPISGRSAGR